MAPKSVRFHEDAVQEFATAVERYLEHSASVAQQFVQQVARAVELIKDAPLRWPKYSTNTRKFVLRLFPFLIIYRDLEDSIKL